MNENHCFVTFNLMNNMVETMFVFIITSKPSRDFTRPLGSPRGLKGLLHLLNAIVHPTKE
jgi:hypothetical protein